MVKKVLGLALLVYLVSVIAGCQNINGSKKGVEVIVEGGGQFPQFLVGTWKADKHDWEITFEPTGSISSIVHNFGKVRLKSGQVYTKNTKYGGKVLFEPDVWMVHYSPERRELTVEIVINHFLIEMRGGTLKGSIRDVLVGPVCPELWQAQWFNYPKYTAFVPDARELPADFNDNPKESLIFEKIAAGDG